MTGEIAGEDLSSALQTAFVRLRDEWKIFSLHRNGERQSKKYSNVDDLKLHLGCGPNVKEGWVNIDLAKTADLTLDLRRPLPFRDQSCSAVYSEHFLEHLDYPHCAGRFLAECRRVLKPGGELSVGVPDTEWPLLEYSGVRNDKYFEMAKSAWHPSWCQTRLEHINYHFRQDAEHRFAYDYETLAGALVRAGFVGVRMREFDPELDSEHRRIGTLYVNAYALRGPEA